MHSCSKTWHSTWSMVVMDLDDILKDFLAVVTNALRTR